MVNSGITADMDDNQPKSVAVIVIPDGNISNLNRLIASIARQECDVQLAVPWQYVESIDSGLISHGYDVNDLDCDVAKILNAVKGNVYVFCTFDSYYPDGSFKDAILAMDTAPCVCIKSYVIQGDGSATPPDYWTTLYAIFAKDESIAQVLLKKGKLSWAEFVFAFGAEFSNSSIYYPDACVYSSFPDQFEAKIPIDSLGWLEQIKHLQFETQLSLIEKYVDNSGESPLSQAIQVVNSRVVDDAIRIGTVTVLVDHWLGKAIRENNSDAYHDAVALLGEAKKISNCFDPTLVALGIDESLYELMARCNLDEYRYMGAGYFEANRGSNAGPDNFTETSSREVTLLELEEIKELRTKNAQLQHRLKRLRDSYSYRLGHAILVGPYNISKSLRKMINR